MISIMIAYTHTYTLTCSPLIQNLQRYKKINKWKKWKKEKGKKESKEIRMTSADAGRADATCNMPYAIMRCTPKGHDEISFWKKTWAERGIGIIPVNKYETYHQKKTLHFKRSHPCHVFKGRRTHEIWEDNKTSGKGFYRITVMTHINIIRGSLVLFIKRRALDRWSVCKLGLLLRPASTCTSLAFWRMRFNLRCSGYK